MKGWGLLRRGTKNELLWYVGMELDREIQVWRKKWSIRKKEAYSFGRQRDAKDFRADHYNRHSNIAVVNLEADE